MNKKRKFVLTINLLFLCIIGFCIFPVSAQLHEAVEEKRSDSGNLISRIDMQGDAVYEDDSGYSQFALWLYGKVLYFSYSTRIVVYIYYTAYYKIHYIYPSIPDSFYWDTPPEDLIEWTGDWDYNYDDTNKKWYWNYDSTYRYCNDYYDDKVVSGSGSNYSTESVKDNYRYLGWAKSQRSGHWHQFQALLKLHIDNEKAEYWDDGEVEETYEYIRIKSVEQIRVKLVFKIQYELFGWRTLATHTHILGDGTPSGDLSSIPLVLGTVIGLI